MTTFASVETLLSGGEDAASPRYIFTYLAPIARHLFPEEDDILLDHLEDDGQLIEPKFFCPILPLLLINGAQGIGKEMTGRQRSVHSTHWLAMSPAVCCFYH